MERGVRAKVKSPLDKLRAFGADENHLSTF
jgi:hypothetical protein